MVMDDAHRIVHRIVSGGGYEGGDSEVSGGKILWKTFQFCGCARVRVMVVVGARVGVSIICVLPAGAHTTTARCLPDDNS